MKQLFGIIIGTFLLASCGQSQTSEHTTKEIKSSSDYAYNKPQDSLQTAYFASGCFWCVEAVFESVEGVYEAVSGYTAGSEKDPTYYSVSSGKSGHAEAVMV